MCVGAGEALFLGSPRRLNLEIVCTPGTPARDTLDVWPALPLCVEDCYGPDLIEGFDNILAVLERRDRVHEINLVSIPSSHLGKVLGALREPFPELTDLALWCEGTQRVIPHDLFGGPAPPRLELLELCGISFLGLPQFLSSATHLHTLILEKIPDFVCIPPDEMVDSLSMMTGLVYLCLKFKSPWRGWTIRPPSTRTVFPALTYFLFEGTSKYLEDLVARIDAPQLKKLSITFFTQITFDTPQFIQFVSRTLKPLEKARVIFQDDTAWVNLSSRTSDQGELNVQISYDLLDWRLFSLGQVRQCTPCLPPLFMLEDLYIYQALNWIPDWQDDIEDPLWLEILHPFNAAKNLYLAKVFAPIVPALQEVLPALQNIFLEGLQPLEPVQEDIGKFVAARQLSGHPIAVSPWERESGLPMGVWAVERGWEY